MYSNFPAADICVNIFKMKQDPNCMIIMDITEKFVPKRKSHEKQYLTTVCLESHN